NSSVKKSASIALAFLFVAMAAILSTSSEATGRTAFDTATLFKAKCASCHGADGSGNTAMGKKLSVRDLRSSQVQSQSDAQLAAIISKGKGKMPPYEKSLNQQQVQELVSFIRKLGGKS
ncbi:MAG: cytochrome c, partial [Acidobacteriota bacterium]